MWVKKLQVVSGIAVVALISASCGGTTKAEPDSAGPSGTTKSAGPITVKDASGREHTFKKPPRIGSLWYGAMLTMADVGVVPDAAIATRSDFKSRMVFPDGTPPTRLSNSEWDNVESWAKADVDVILAGGPADPGYDAIEAAAPVFLLNSPPWFEGSAKGIDALKDNTRMLGKLVGAEDGADQAIERFDNYLAALKKVAPPEAADEVVAVMQHDDDGSFWVNGGNDPFCLALHEVGLGSCPDGVVEGEMNAEAFLAADPDWIVYSLDDAKGSWKDRHESVWPKLSAVKNGHIFDTDAYSYSDSLRVVEYLLQLYASKRLGSDVVPEPGPFKDTDPSTSPLAAP